MRYETANAFYIHSLNVIGGIESHLYYMAKKYGKYDMTVFYRHSFQNQIQRLSPLVRCVKLEDGDTIVCENLFYSYGKDILNQVTAKNIYYVVHADYKNQVEKGQISRAYDPTDERITAYLGVSQIACDSWKAQYGKEADLVYMPVLPDEEEPLLLMSATRLTAEKGWNRMRILAEELNRNHVKFLWLVFTNGGQKDIPENMVFVKPRLDSSGFLKKCDAFVQLSDSEALCLAGYEAMKAGVPIIGTKLPIFYELGLNEDNAVLLDFDMNNIPVDKIKNIRQLKHDFKEPAEKWNQYLSHKKSNYKWESKDYIATGNWGEIIDAHTGRVPKAGDIVTCYPDRLEQIRRAEKRMKVKLLETDL